MSQETVEQVHGNKTIPRDQMEWPSEYHIVNMLSE
jgi:hypothetical protein